MTSTSPVPDPDDSRESIHQLNGRLLLALKRLIPEAKWEEWIVNVIILYRKVEAVETVTLETSATLYRDEPFFSRKDCEDRGRNTVRNLDGYVPIHDSYAGYCILQGDVVWVDKVETTNRPSSSGSFPLQDRYRDFAYVGVKTPGLPRSEYVFPIRLRIGLSGTILGVLNCEWYGPLEEKPQEKENMFQTLQREYVVHLVTQLLDVHAGFLPLAFDRARAPGGSWEDFLENYYDPCMELHVARIRKGARQ
jgi:hypothetical protein